MSQLSPAEKEAGAFIGRMVQKYAAHVGKKNTVRDLLSGRERTEMYRIADKLEAERQYN